MRSVCTASFFVVCLAFAVLRVEFVEFVPNDTNVMPGCFFCEEKR